MLSEVKETVHLGNRKKQVSRRWLSLVSVLCFSEKQCSLVERIFSKKKTITALALSLRDFGKLTLSGTQLSH